MKSLNSACAASLLEQGIGSNCMGSSESDGRNGLLDSPCSTASSLSSLTPPATPFSGSTSSKLQSVPLASLHQSSLLLRQLSEPPSSVAANDYGCVLLDSGREYIALGELNYNNGQGSGQAGGVQAEMDFLENISGFGYANAAAATATAGDSNTTATTSYNGYNGAAAGNSYTEHSAAAAGVGAAAVAAAAASHTNGALNYLGTPGKAAADIDPKEIDQYLMDQMLPMHPHPHAHPHGQPQSHPHAQHMPGQSPPPLNSSASLSSACSSASSQPVECLPSPYEHYEHISYPSQAQNGAGYAQHYATDQQQQQQQHPQQHLSQQQQQQQHHHLWSTYVNP